MQFKEIKDKNIWEEFVSKQANSSHFQSFLWGEFENSIRHNVEHLGIFENEKFVGLLNLRRVRARRGKYLYLRHGPIFDFSDERTGKEIINFLVDTAKKEGFSFIRMSPLIPVGEKFDWMKNFQPSQMHDIDAEITWVLNLSDSEEILLKNMRANTRYAIKKAQKLDIKIIKTKNLKYFDEFWKIYQDTVQRQKWTAYDYGYIKKEFEIFAKENQAELYLTKFKDKFIAGSIIVYYQNQGIYHHSGTLSEFRNLPASYLIQWEAIKESKKRGLKYYNFWGISPLEYKNNKPCPIFGHPWEGLTFFKIGFGGEKREFVHAMDLAVSRKYLFTKVFDWVERKRRGY